MAKSKNRKLKMQSDQLKRFALRVRLLPTIEAGDIQTDEVTSFGTNHVAGFIHGYNKAILEMRKIFEEEGFTV